jgi:hypothetical protein
MQARTHTALTERVLYYAARDYGGQLPRGADYSELTPTVSVLWVDARLFPNERRFHLRFELLETESHVRFTDHLTSCSRPPCAACAPTTSTSTSTTP